LNSSKIFRGINGRLSRRKKISAVEQVFVESKMTYERHIFPNLEGDIFLQNGY
jgi:hypothetical protein